MNTNNGEKMYLRVCEGLQDKGKLIPATDDIYKHIKNPDKDYYFSIYKYNQEQRDTFNKTGTIAGIKDVSTNLLVFDFDSKDVEKARQDAIITLDRLKSRGINAEDLNIYYSGSKGFHIVLDTENATFTPKEAKDVALEITKGLKTADSVVYNASRVFRLPYTKHPVTGLYKTPLSRDELVSSSIDEIKEVAKDNYAPEPMVKTKVDKSKLVVMSKAEKPESTLLHDLDLSKRPSYLSPWKYALEQGFFPPGQRSNSLIILAATYKSLGYNETKAYYALKASAELQSKRFGQTKFSKDEIYKNVISPVYGDSWAGGTYAEDNFPREIQEYLQELGVPRKDAEEQHENYVMDIGGGFDRFIKYAENIDENTMKFGIGELDSKLKVQAGHLVGVLAPPGVGKTSMAITLLNNTSKQDIKSFFASYDMSGDIVTQKLIQRETGFSDEVVFDAFRNKDKEKIEKFRYLLNREYENVSFCFKVGQTLPELRESIKREEMRLGKPIKLVIVDYLELVRTKSNDPTGASMEAVQGLREIANDGRVVVVLLQPNKMSSTVDEPLLSYNAAKGSSTIAQACTSIISCHRPGYDSRNPQNDKYFGVNVIKNRMGPLSSADFSWDGPTGRIATLNDVEKQALKELRALKKMEKEGDDGF